MVAGTGRAARHVSQSVATDSGDRVCTSQTVRYKGKPDRFAMQKLSARVIITDVRYY